MGRPWPPYASGDWTRRKRTVSPGRSWAARPMSAATTTATTGYPEVDTTDTTVTADDLRAAYRELAGEQAIGFNSPAL
jgi:hypothetical protein